ncbi:MAG: RcpC/CpaB family pilus assembly protein [Solirubrobacteraceae bacterium]
MRLKSKRLAGTGVRGMLSSRQGALALALLCALAAGAILIFALGRYKKSVNTTPKQATVLVATGLIQKGESGSTIAAEQLYKPMPVLESQLPATSISDASVLHGKYANADILPGQQLAYGQFNASPGPVGQLAQSQRGITLSVDPQHGLGGVVAAGDHVDVYGAYVTKAGTQFVTLVVPDALVVKAPGTGNDAGTTTLLNVNMKYAPQLAYTAEWGKVWFVLRGSNATNPPKEIIGADTILAGVKLTPLQQKIVAELRAAASGQATPTSNPIGAQP